MITKEEFTRLITDHLEYDKEIDKVASVLGESIYNCDWSDYGNMLFDKIIDLTFTPEGGKDIIWWMWEKDGRPEFKMWDENGNEIPTETIDDLWEIVKDYRK